MADANKQQPAWTFGNASTAEKPGNPVGQGATTSQAPSGSGLFGSNAAPPANSGTGGLFGSGSKPPTTSGTGLFGSSSAASGSGFFGGAPGTIQPQSSSSFGTSGGEGSGNNNVFGGGSKPASGPSNQFQGNGNNTTGGLFGSSQAASQGSQAVTSSAPSVGFSGFSTPSKPSEASSSGQQKPNLFGGGASTGGNIFGNLGASSSAGQAHTTTPTSKPTTSLFGNSTTPAGPPPNGTAGAGPTFNFQKPQSQAEDSGKVTDSSSKAVPSMFGSNPQSSQSLFGASKPPAATDPKTQSTSIFDSASKGNSNIFDSKRAAQPEGGLFSNANQNKSQDTGINKPNPFTATASAGQASSAPGIGGSSINPKFGFPSDGGSLPSMAGASLPFTASSMFTTSKPTASSEAAAQSASTTASSFFPSLGKPQDNATTSAPPPSSASAATTTPSLFNASKPAAPAGLSAAPTQDTSKAPAPSAMTGASNANLGASVTGPAPPPQSRLKNKSMDDIINRWASDLSKYQKEFQAQAEKVAQWDRMLVENSDRIQRLYGSTLEAERATSEVERQLTAVENDQAELELWLDHYEKEVDSMIANQVGQGESISGPDQERERT